MPQSVSLGELLVEVVKFVCLMKLLLLLYYRYTVVCRSSTTQTKTSKNPTDSRGEDKQSTVERESETVSETMSPD